MKEMQLVISCEHASHHVPARYRPLFAKANRILASHRGYDIGALECARRFATDLEVPLVAATATRLLADCNRSEHNRNLWSSYTRRLSKSERAELLDTVYHPYRSAVIDAVHRRTRRGGRVFHLSVHSFTPRLRGQVRHFDIGLLYDPRRRSEREFALRWRRVLQQDPQQLRVRCNAPYKGVSDGMIPYLRQQFPAPRYTGIEIEINQSFPLGQRRHWVRLQQTLLETFKALI